MLEVTLDVSMQVKGPLVSGASAAGAFGVDLPFAQDHQKRYYIPWSHIKGRLREALDRIGHLIGARQEDLVDWLGRESQPQSADTPERGRFLFSDFHVCTDPDALSKTRIAMDHQRGAVKKGHYLVIESPFSSGLPVWLRGSIRFFCAHEQEKDRITDIVDKGLRWIPAVGGMRSVGFGLVQQVQIQGTHVPMPDSVPELDACSAYAIHLKSKSPFCLARPGVRRNTFVSETIISGSALKGSLANSINAILDRPLGQPIGPDLPEPWTELGIYFQDLRFRHAFPGGQDHKRPQYPPLSVVRAPGDQESIFDVILCPRPGVINGKAPIFSPDWKGYDLEAVNHAFGWGKSPDTEVRVRTSIDSGKRRAKSHNLFAVETVIPDAHTWYSQVDLSQIPEAARSKVWSQLHRVFDFGLRYLGKTKADVQVQSAGSTTDEVPDPYPEGVWVLTLQTPVLTIYPDPALNHDDHEVSQGGQSRLFEAYAAYWQEISKGTLQLCRFMAAQALLGGYLHYRYQGQGAYNPYLVTSPGSVFMLQSTEEAPFPQTRKYLLEWVQQGLPLPEWAIQSYGSSWQTCPFIPENGYGEIALNMPCHTENKPGQEIFQEVQA